MYICIYVYVCVNKNSELVMLTSRVRRCSRGLETPIKLLDRGVAMLAVAMGYNGRKSKVIQLTVALDL